MKSPKNLLLVGLAAAVIALAALSWNQYLQLAALRAQVAADPSAALRRQLADATKQIRALRDRLAAARGSRRGGPEGDGPEDGPGGPGGPGRPWGRFGAFASLSGNPEFQKLLSIQTKARITQTYAALFKTLNLSPEQLSQFQSLLAEKQQAMMDTLQAAREQGVNPQTDPEGFKALMAQAVAQTDQQIQQTLGDAAFQQYQQYQQSLPERNTVNSLQTALSYSQTPLTDDQANALIPLLQANQPERAGSGAANTTGGPAGGPGLMALMNGGGTARVTDDAVAQASSILSAPQVSALQQIEQQQQAQQQMQQMMRQASQGAAPGAAGATAATTKG